MNIIIFGPQGSGKGTQANLLMQKFNMEHVEAGSILREEAKHDTEQGKKIDEIINQKNELVPNDIVSEVLRKSIEKVPKTKGIILDGAPRTTSQIKIVEDIFKENNRKIDKAISIHVSENKSLERILVRVSCSECNRKFVIGKEIKSLDEKCPVCDGEIAQRKDDTLNGIKKRLEIFKNQTKLAIEYYKGKGLLAEINGEQSIEKVFADVISSIENK